MRACSILMQIVFLNIFFCVWIKSFRAEYAENRLRVGPLPNFPHFVIYVGECGSQTTHKACHYNLLCEVTIIVILTMI